MSQKEVEKHTCQYCESTYKILYSLDETSGQPKFCPICGSETYDNEDLKYGEDDDIES